MKTFYRVGYGVLATCVTWRNSAVAESASTSATTVVLVVDAIAIN